MKRITFIVAVLCSVSLAIAACGGDDDDGDETVASATVAGAAATAEPDEPDEPEGGGINACELITTDEAAEAVGGPVEEPERSSIGENFDQCLWRIEGGTDVDAAVVLQARPNTSRDDFDRLIEENAPEELGAVETVDGLGDAAFEQIATFVLEDDVMVVVTVINDDPDGGTAKQQPLARAAIGRLP